ncbi:MAG: GntR family transcriptional regulator [Clostridia bacterium]|nr:GntR family transcriptional regulator [Clostridia bacterium]
MTDYIMLKAFAYEHLRDMIQTNVLEFNKVYSETKIAADLSISRTPVREALVRLNNERYIDILPSRGFMLHKPTDEDIVESYHVRMATESYCGRILAREYQSEDGRNTIASMRSLLDRQIEIDRQSYEQNRVEFWQVDVQFHNQLVNYIKCPSFDNLFNTFIHFFMSLRIKNFIHKGRNKTTLIEHERIVDALTRGDEQATLDAIQTHLKSSLDITLSSLETLN